MTAATDSARWRQVIDRFDRQHPDAGRLARLASLAVRVESRLLRRLRLRFLPSAPAACEADLWWSALVAARGGTAFSWSAGAAEALRAALRELETIDPAAVRAEIAALHAGESPLVQLEEEVAWLALRGAGRAEIERALGRAVRALVDHPEHADDLAAWSVHALPALPTNARETAAAWQLQMAAVSRFGATPAMGVPAPSDLLAHVAHGVLVDRGRERLRVVRDGVQLSVEVAPDAADSDPAMLSVPRTRPLWLEVTSDRGNRRIPFAVAPQGKTQITAADGDVLRNALGESWLLESVAAAQIGASSDVEPGEVIVSWLMVRMPMDGRTAWDAVRDAVIDDIKRSVARVGRVGVLVQLRTEATAGSLEFDDAPITTDLIDAIHGEEQDSVETESLNPGLPLLDVPAISTRTWEQQVGARWIGFVQLNDDPLSTEERRTMGKGLERTIVPEGDATVTIVSGPGCASLVERRFPPGQAPVLIIDPTTSWTVAAPGIRVPLPTRSLAHEENGRRSASYVLGAVRKAPSSDDPATADMVIASLERSLIDGEWRERSLTSESLGIGHPGDPDVRWARNDVVVVIGAGGSGSDGPAPLDAAFVSALRTWFEEDGGLLPDSFCVLESPEDTKRVMLALQDRSDAPRTIWLFLGSGQPRRRELALRDFFEVARMDRNQLIAFVDGDVPREHLASLSTPFWVAAASKRSSPSNVLVTSAGFEALRGAHCSGTGAEIGFDDLKEHLQLRCSAEILTSRGAMWSDRAAPPPTHVRVDTAALRRIAGGWAVQDPPKLESVRLVFVTGATAPARSAWIDRNFTAEMTRAIYVNDAIETVAGAALGWTPSLCDVDAIVARARTTLLEWSSPGELSEPEELAWRIDGANALFVLDGLGFEATSFERELVEAFERRRAGRMLVTTPHITGWMMQYQPHAVIDLDDRPTDAGLARYLERALVPTPTEWIAGLLAWGHDQPVTTASRLRRLGAGKDEQADVAWTELERWLEVGDPGALSRVPADPQASPPASIACFVRDAAIAIADGDREQMLARIGDAIAFAVKWFGVEECKRTLSGQEVQSASLHAAIQIREIDGRFRLFGAWSGGKAWALVDNPLPTAPSEMLRGFAPIVAAFRSEPLALVLPASSSSAHTMPWEHALLEATLAKPNDLHLQAAMFRTHGEPSAAAATYTSRGDVLSFVHSHGQAGLVTPVANQILRALAQRNATAESTFAPPFLDTRVGGLKQNLAGSFAASTDRLGWNLHVIGAPLDDTSVWLQPDFVDIHDPLAAEDDRLNVVQLADQIHPHAVLLQDVPSAALAASLQSRQRAARLRSLAGVLAASVPIVVVIPAVPPEVVPLVLRELFYALAQAVGAPKGERLDAADAMPAAVARARGLIFEHTTAAPSAALALAADLVVWRPNPTVQRPDALGAGVL